MENNTTNQIRENELDLHFDKLVKMRSNGGYMRTKEIPGGNILDRSRKSFMWDYNMNPSLISSDKYYKLVKVLKSDTWAVPWLIKMHDKYFVVVLGEEYKRDVCVSLYESDKKGNRKQSLDNPLYRIYGISDMETGCDLLVYHYIFDRIKDGRFDNLHIFE